MKYSINDLAEYTGLKVDFIRKCVKYFEDLFEPYMDRGDKNSLMFDSNALVIFDRIKQMKEKGLTVKSIGDYLHDELAAAEKEEKSKHETAQANNMKDYFEMLMREIKDSHRTTIDAKDETIYTQKSQINTLESKILLLTDGRSPEEMKRKQEEEERKRDDERHKIELERRSREEELLKQQHIQQQRTQLLMELENLEGQLFKGRQRKEIVERLKALG